MRLLFRKLKGLISRKLFPFYSWCYRCGCTWNVCDPHTTHYQYDHNSLVSTGCFPICEKCWSELTIKQRIPYYLRLWHEWVNQGTTKTSDTLVLIIKAVREGK